MRSPIYGIFEFAFFFFVEFSQRRQLAWKIKRLDIDTKLKKKKKNENRGTVNNKHFLRIDFPPDDYAFSMRPNI